MYLQNYIYLKLKKKALVYNINVQLFTSNYAEPLAAALRPKCNILKVI